MKIVFVVNSVESEKAQSSALLMWKAHQRGHQVYAAGVGAFSFAHNQPLGLHAVRLAKPKEFEDAAAFLKELQQNNVTERLTSKDIDVLMLRNNPTEEASGRTWAEHAGVAYGRMMQQQGVMVLNDAYALSYAFIDKLYFEEFPTEIKPSSIITRNKDELMDFYSDHNENMVLKPLEGSGGQNVYRIDPHEKNMNQIVDGLLDKGYVIAQEYLPGVKDGDVRVLLLNGRVLTQNGQQAAIKRVAGDGEFRSNFALGASADNAPLTDAMKRIVELTAPKIIHNGLFFIGLDFVEDKLIELNVLSPGGLEYFQDIDLPDFTDTIIEAVERKLHYKKRYGHSIENRVLATLA